MEWHTGAKFLQKELATRAQQSSQVGQGHIQVGGSVNDLFVVSIGDKGARRTLARLTFEPMIKS